VWGGTPASAVNPVIVQAELVTHRDYYPGNVVFRDGLPVALIDFDLAKPTTRLYDIVNALWYWAPLRDPRDRAPAFRDLDIPRRIALFADTYGMTARQRAGLASFAADVAHRYHEDARISAELDPVFRKLWEDGAKDQLPRRGLAARGGPGDHRPPDPGRLGLQLSGRERYETRDLARAGLPERRGPGIPPGPHPREPARSPHHTHGHHDRGAGPASGNGRIADPPARRQRPVRPARAAAFAVMPPLPQRRRPPWASTHSAATADRPELHSTKAAKD
jgi:hypothetical protein